MTIKVGSSGGEFVATEQALGLIKIDFASSGLLDTIICPDGKLIRLTSMVIGSPSLSSQPNIKVEVGTRTLIEGTLTMFATAEGQFFIGNNSYDQVGTAVPNASGMGEIFGGIGEDIKFTLTTGTTVDNIWYNYQIGELR